MKPMPLYAIYDRKAEHSPGPWMAANDEVAKRSFAQLAQDKTSNVGAFPSDFELRLVGYWDAEKTRVEGIPNEDGFRILAYGIDYTGIKPND